MKLDNTELYNFFIAKDIYFLYHANTVTTACTFINEGGLLSRGAVQNRNLVQTAQMSDIDDVTHNVWNDIFLDTTDLHTHFKRQNHYGPVVFKFSINFLVNSDFDIWITKNNPINWNNEMSDSDKYFTSVNELKDKWDEYPRQRKMITIRNIMIPVLFDSLMQVIVDNPNVERNKINYFNNSVFKLKAALLVNPPLKKKFITRDCKKCYCKTNYLYQMSTPDLNRFFL